MRAETSRTAGKTRAKTGTAARRPRRFTLAKLARPFVAAVLFFGCLLLAAAFIAIAIQDNAVAREITGTRAEIALLTADVAAKHAEIAVKQTDAYALQRARDLGYARPGESLIAIRSDDTAAPTTIVDDRAPGRLARWVQLFFSR
ncbi:MAG: hypothetical protein HY071_03415 [Chloroflexi bacterium]|nr:hypothetical protein [Chloroflexota bacterium]